MPEIAASRRRSPAPTTPKRRGHSPPLDRVRKPISRFSITEFAAARFESEPKTAALPFGSAANMCFCFFCYAFFRSPRADDIGGGNPLISIVHNGGDAL
jgi:hypothetical protein